MDPLRYIYIFFLYLPIYVVGFIVDYFTEMAERHDAKTVLQTARNLVRQLQTLIENK